MREKTGQKLFFTGKNAIFFENLCFQQPLRFYRNDLVTSTVIVKSPCGPLWIIPWGVSHSIIGEQLGHKLFFTGKFAFFFQKIVFSTTSPVLQKWSCNFHSSCQNTLWILINCFLRLVTLDSARKKQANIFSSLESMHFSFENLCFQQPLRFYRNDLVTSTVSVRSPCGPLWIIPWGLSHSIMRENRPKSFLRWKVCVFFFQNLCFQQPFRCYRNDLVSSTVVVKKACGFL